MLKNNLVNNFLIYIIMNFINNTMKIVFVTSVLILSNSWARPFKLNGWCVYRICANTCSANFVNVSDLTLKN